MMEDVMVIYQAFAQDMYIYSNYPDLIKVFNSRPLLKGICWCHGTVWYWMITTVYPCTMYLQSTMKNTVILPRYVQKTIFYVECFEQTFSLASHLTIEQ